MALLHVASKHLGMNVLMFIRRLGIHSGLYGSKFWLFSPSLKQYERFIAAEIFTIERKGGCGGGGGVLLVPFIIHKVGDLQYLL